MAHVVVEGCFCPVAAGVQRNEFRPQKDVKLKDAVDLLLLDESGDISPYVSLLRQCASSKALAEGKRLHGHLIKTGLDRDKLVQDLLVQMYGKCGRLEDACKVFDAIQQRDSISYNIMIAVYARNGHLQRARITFEQMPQQDLVSWNTMIAAYAQNGHLEEACNMFEKMPSRDLVSWNSMISAYARAEHAHQALKLFESLETAGLKPNEVTFLGVLDACATLGAFAEGKAIHAKIVATGFQVDIKIGNALIGMYGKCRSPEEARLVFDRIPRRDVISWNSMISAYAQNGHLLNAKTMFDAMPQRSTVSWNAMITAYAQNGHARGAIALFHAMDEEPDAVTFLSIIEACANLADLAEGRTVEAFVLSSPHKSDLKVGNALIHMYGKCGSLSDAWNAFDRMTQHSIVSWNAMVAAYAQNGHLENAQGLFVEMPGRDVISWNTMIAALAQNGHEREAIELFRLMGEEGVKPNMVTFVSLVDACGNLGALAEGRIFHNLIVDHGYESETNIQNVLVNMYGKCGRVGDARSVFDRMSHRDVVSWNGMLAVYAQNGHLQDAKIIFDGIPQKDVVSWNSMIAAFGQNGQSQDALRLFAVMDCEGVKPDEVTFISVLDVCAKLAAISAGKEIHHSLGDGEENLLGIKLANAMISMYGNCGRVEDAKSVFDRMPEHNLVSWTAIIGAYAQNGDLQDAKAYFDQMPQHDVAAWNAMIGAYTQNGYGKEALRIFRLMETEGIQPDEITFSSIPDACCRPGDPLEAKFVHARIQSSGFQSPLVGTALVNMYGKCGNLHEARMVFEGLHEQNVVTWNSIIAAYSQNGHVNEAFTMFAMMGVEGVTPSEVTFLVILSACSHAGLLHHGCHYFLLMKEEHRISPRAGHYACLVDVFARSGRLQDAQELLRSMPFQPDFEAWVALLGGCSIQGHAQQGAYAAEQASMLSPDDAAPYILASNLYRGMHGGVSSFSPGSRDKQRVR